MERLVCSRKNDPEALAGVRLGVVLSILGLAALSYGIPASRGAPLW
jgi:hypothetical protein